MKLGIYLLLSIIILDGLLSIRYVNHLGSNIYIHTCIHTHTRIYIHFFYKWFEISHVV